MYTLRKTMEVSASHCLDLPYESKCKNLHGHNWIITVEIMADNLVNGMVMDFVDVKDVVMELDHTNISGIIPDNPTAENIAKWIAERITARIDGRSLYSAFVSSVTVIESEGNTICYTP